jgi:hypothetical protein
MTLCKTLWPVAAVMLLCAPALAGRYDFPFEKSYAAEEEDVELASYNEVQYDPNVRPAQATSSSSGRTAARSRTSRVPYMIGDTPLSGASGMGSLEISTIYFDSFTGETSTTELVEIEQPVIGGIRLNVAEGNTALPEDRFIFSYRHFTNAIDTNVLGAQSFLNMDQWVVGFEKTFFNELGSLAIQMPFYRQLDSNLDVSVDSTGANFPSDQQNGEIGNLNGYLKVLLYRTSSCAFSFGVGCSTPTADDTTIRGNFEGPFTLSNNPPVQATAPSTFFFQGRIENHTVDVVPYIAWAVRDPQTPLFHQGFLQVDVPVNSSEASFRSTGTIVPDAGFAPDAFDVTSTDRLSYQALLRANLGFGYWFYEQNSTRVAGIVECHYTSNVSSGDATGLQIANFAGGGDDLPLNLAVGQTNNFDFLNLTAGIAVDLGTCLITNGVAVPLLNDEDRAFDMEYNLQIHQRF